MNRHDLEKLNVAYTQVHEGTMDIKGFEIPKKEQEAAAKRVKEKTVAKKNIRGNDSEEQKKRLEKKRGMKLDDHPQFKKEEVSPLAAAYNAVYEVEETETVAEDDKSYDRNRKRAAQRAADRNAARAAGKTGVVPGVGYVTARKEKESYTDSKGVERHKSGAKNEEYEVEGFIPINKEKQTKIDRQIGRAADKESIEQGKSKKYGRDEKKIEKQYQRQQAMRFGKKMKKEELEATGKFTAEEIDAIINVDIEEGKGKAAAGGAIGDVVGRVAGGLGGAALAKVAGIKTPGQMMAANIGSKVGGVAGGATGAALGAKKGRKGSAAVAGAGGSLVAGPIGAGVGGAIASSYEPEGNPIHEVFKDDIEQFAVNEIADILTKLAGGARDLGAKFGPKGTEIASKIIDTTKSGVKLAKKHPLRTAAIGTAGAGLGAAALMNDDDK